MRLAAGVAARGEAVSASVEAHEPVSEWLRFICGGEAAAVEEATMAAFLLRETRFDALCQQHMNELEERPGRREHWYHPV